MSSVPWQQQKAGLSPRLTGIWVTVVSTILGEPLRLFHHPFFSQFLTFILSFVSCFPKYASFALFHSPHPKFPGTSCFLHSLSSSATVFFSTSLNLLRHTAHMLADLIVPPFKSPFDPPVLLNTLSSFLRLTFPSSSNNFLCPPPLSFSDSLSHSGDWKQLGTGCIYTYMIHKVTVQCWSKCHFHLKRMFVYNVPNEPRDLQ